MIVLFLDRHSDKQGGKDRKDERLDKCYQQFDQTDKDSERNGDRCDHDVLEDEDQADQ